MEPTSKWSGAFWRDLAERVGSTAIYALITLVTANQVADINADLAWTIVGLPTLLALLKGLGSNMASPDSGASLLPAPPGPVLEEEGAVNWLAVIAVAAVAVALVLIFGNFDFNVNDNGK